MKDNGTFKIAGLRAEINEGVADALTLRLESPDGGCPVSIDIRDGNATYAAWAMLILGAVSAARSRASLPECQQQMAEAFTAAHSSTMDALGDGRASEIFARDIVPTVLRSVAGVCVEMAEELERDGVTAFRREDGR